MDQQRHISTSQHSLKLNQTLADINFRQHHNRTQSNKQNVHHHILTRITIPVSLYERSGNMCGDRETVYERYAELNTKNARRQHLAKLSLICVFLQFFSHFHPGPYSVRTLCYTFSLYSVYVHCSCAIMSLTLLCSSVASSSALLAGTLCRQLFNTLFPLYTKHTCDSLT